MFGKHFGSMYTGSMVGSGAVVFAVMGYVIANAVPVEEAGLQVELDPVILATILGEEVTEVEQAIEFLREPDPNSRSQEEEGRRLVRVGQFDYRVVNGPRYREMRSEESRKRQNRAAQARFREKRKKSVPPLPWAAGLTRRRWNAGMWKYAESSGNTAPRRLCTRPPSISSS
jgi:hypothetical protein